MEIDTDAPDRIEGFEPDRCKRCGRLPTIDGRDETVYLSTAGGFVHAVCDDRWDP